MNIYQKIANIMSEVRYLAKDDKVEFGATKYKAISEEKVTSIMREQLMRQGLVVYPKQMTSNRNGQITHVDVVYRLVNIDDPEDYIDIASCGDGADSQDKGSGKAMTYAYKYMWLRTFAIPTGDDPDKISSAELDAKQEQAQESADLLRDEILSMSEDGERLTAWINKWLTIYGNGIDFDRADANILKKMKVALLKKLNPKK